jgi:hypothetical protein
MNALSRYLLAVGLALLPAACATVEQGVLVDCEVQPVPPDWERNVAPEYFPARVDRFKEVLLETDENIRVMEAEELWQTLFADRDPGAGLSINEFRHSDIAIRVAALGVRHLIVLDTGPREPIGEPSTAVVYDDPDKANNQGAVMLTFRGASCEMERYTATVSGGDQMGWYYLAYHFDADTPEQALRAVTGRMAAFIQEQSVERPVTVVVVAARP